jgi:hypothetical protein
MELQMKVHELLSMPKLEYKKGFRVGKGKIIWTDVHVNGDRKRIRISRTHQSQAFTQYLKPHTEVEIVK